MGTEGTARKAKVAIVDDEVDITIYLRLALEDHGYEVVTINDTTDAMAVLEQRVPDVILLDLLMPRTTGTQLYGCLAAHPELAETPIVILSGLNAEEDLPGMLAREDSNLPLPAGFIEKPINIEEVLSTLKDVLLTAGKGVDS